MTSEPLRTIRDRFSEFVDRVQRQHERVTVTRNGRAAAVLISPQDLESLEETVAVLSDSAAIAELVDARRAYLEGDVVRGSDAVRALRPESPSTATRSSSPRLPPERSARSFPRRWRSP